ncbi:Outer membrane protein A precursor [hydrothermal vent metagenome]|uniref:Outer membrane protein A n=1 Tax=hydrothermal vent metagenome TaxID=652676 RepID=A0A1W1BMY6_9ZZZZ
MFKKKVIQGILISLLIGGCSIKEASLESSSDKPVVLFILDTSESMLNLENGKSKMENAKKSIVDTVSKIDSNRFNTGLITFDNTRRCRAKTAVELGDPKNILDSIDEVEAWGVSPLADAIARSNEMLSGTEKKMLILLSDGKDNCGGDPVAEAKKLYKKYGVKVNLQVIGYAVEKKKQDELKKIARISKDWMYHDTVNGANAKKIVQKIIEKIQPKQQTPSTISPIEREEVEPPRVIYNVPAEDTEYDSIDSSNFEVGFSSGSNNLSSSYIAQIKKLYDYLKDNNKKVTLIGHADSRGTESYNQKLSEQRAETIKFKLIEFGINADRIEAIGKGENEPIATNTTKEGRRKNRRVEIEILD